MVIEWITINWIEVYCHRHINYEDLAHTAMLYQEDGGAALVQYGVFLGNINLIYLFPINLWSDQFKINRWSRWVIVNL